jgi:hypothetical protein
MLYVSFIIHHFFIHHFFHAPPRMISSLKASAETHLTTTLCKSVRYYTATMTANAQQSCFARRGTSQERDFCNALKFWGLTRALDDSYCDPYRLPSKFYRGREHAKNQRKPTKDQDEITHKNVT